ncbi:MAG: YHS domain-containing protein [Gammaproteobacteria bacterium]|nr:YHS domain-containing protein [Gammaproteobacteria bacterium]
MEKDPVCGMLVDPKQAAGQRQYQEKTYYLCSPACLDRFDQAPQRYVPTDKPDNRKERTGN